MSHTIPAIAEKVYVTCKINLSPVKAFFFPLLSLRIKDVGYHYTYGSRSLQKQARKHQIVGFTKQAILSDNGTYS